MKSDNNYLWLLALICATIFFVNLGSLPVNIMEARNFITAREMLQDGHWMLPTINGEPRYQKPPLPTWLTAFSAAIFGIKEVWALRLPAAFMAMGLVLVFYKLGLKITSENNPHKQNQKYAFLSALILATSFYIVASARDGQWDIYTHAFMVFSIYPLIKLFTEKAHRYRNAMLAGLFFGCSFLSKGPVSFYALLLPFLISFGIVYRYKDFKSRILPTLVFILVAIIVSSWWHFYTLMFDKEAVLEITKNETSNWTSYETKPFYYYWSFFTQSGLWTIPAFIALLYPYLKSRVFDKKAYLFTFLWTIGSVILLSIIPEKKSRYLLPVLIPLALNTGFYIEYLIRSFSILKNKKETFPVYFSFLLIGIIGIAFPIGGYYFLKDGLDTNWFWFIALSISLVTIGVLIFRFMFKKDIEKVFYLNIAFIVAIMIFGLPLVNAIIVNPEYKPMSDLKQWKKNNALSVYEFADMTPELIWDYGSKMVVLFEDNQVTLPSENKFGVTVSEDNLDFFKRSFKDYKVEEQTKYDMNIKGRDSRTHKNRLYRYFFLVTKISD